MPRPELRFTLGKLMKVIGGLAVFLALIRWDHGWLLGFPAVVVGLVAALVHFKGLSYLRAAVSVVAVWPWLMIISLYMSFGSGQLVRNAQPVSGSPSSLGLWLNFSEGITVLFLFCWPLVFLVGLVLIYLDIRHTQKRRNPNRPTEIDWIVLGPGLLWLGAFYFLSIAPGDPIPTALGLSR